MQRTTKPAGDDKSVIVGLWVLLVANEGQLTSTASARVPMMARTGDDQTYLLAFKNMPSARKFLKQTELDGAEPRMVVKGNKTTILQIARGAGAVGILIDYDPITQRYGAATELS